MAFQAPLASMPSMASIATGFFPGASAAFQGPLLQSRVLATPMRNTIARTNNGRRLMSTGRSKGKTELSEPFRHVAIAGLAPKLTHAMLPPTAFGVLRSGFPSSPKSSSISSQVFNSIMRPFSSRAAQSARHSLSPLAVNGTSQRRSFWNNSPSSQSSGGSFSHLSHMEATANNNPTSASAQNAFYSSLLRANRPDLVVQRYESGSFASNPACETLYIRALERLNSGGQTATPGLSGSATGQDHLPSEKLQAVAQAVGSRYGGGSIAVTKGGTGAKQAPLYVVVEESTGSSVFRWVKFVFWGAFAIWITYILVTMLLEAGGVLRRAGGPRSFEAKPELQKQRFSDVHGCEEAKEELQEIVDFLKAPEKYSKHGGKLPKGVLLVGPPGTGKTMLARAVAGEAGVPFFYMSGSEFDEVYVGVGAKRIRELFTAARTKAPAIVFIDELDAIGSKRNERDHAYSKQTLNQLLTDLDGFNDSTGVVFIAATNFPELLDKALTRPGRFDRQVVVGLPDVRGRLSILKHYLKKMHIAPSVDPTIIARGTSGLSGAELQNIVNIAAINASKRKAMRVEMLDLEFAKDRVLMGAERRSAVIQPKDRLATAYHEGGHALMALLTPHAVPLYKATVMPRGHALGITFQLREMDVVSERKEEYYARIDVCMGGSAAEEVIYGPSAITSGPSSDIKAATNIALNMVTRFGMSDKLGNVDYASSYETLPTEIKTVIWDEVKRIIEESRQRSVKILTEKKPELELLAKALYDHETLNKEEMEKVIRGEKLPLPILTSTNSPRPEVPPFKGPELPLPIPPTDPPTSPDGGLGVPGARPVDEPTAVPGRTPPRPYADPVREKSS